MRMLIKPTIFLVLSLQIMILPTRGLASGTFQVSGELLGQLTTSLIIQSAIERNPLPVIQLAENLPGLALSLPPTIYAFNRVADPVSGSVLRLLETKHPNLVSNGYLRGSLSRGAGILSGAAVLRLLIEGMSGDLVKYFDVGWRGELASFMAGMGIGFAASEATLLLGTKALTVAGVSNPAGLATVGFVAGSMFFLTCGPVEEAAHHFSTKRKSRKDLDETIRYSGGMLSGIVRNPGPRPLHGAFRLHLMSLMRAFETHQANILFDVLQLESEYAKEMTKRIQKYFRKIRMAEWARSAPHHEPAPDNIFEWQSEKLPLDLAIELTLAQHTRVERIQKYIDHLKGEMQQELRQLGKHYEVPRATKVKKASQSEELATITENQYQYLAGLVGALLSQVPVLKAATRSLDDLHNQEFVVLSRNLSELQSVYAEAAINLPEDLVIRGDLLFEAASRVAETYRRIRRQNFLQDLVENAESAFTQILDSTKPE